MFADTTLDVSDGKDVIIRVGVITGANTIGSDQLIHGNIVRTVGSAGRYRSNLPYGLVLPIRRDELSTELLPYNKTIKPGTTLEVRCRYYVSAAHAPQAQIKWAAAAAEAEQKKGGSLNFLMPMSQDDPNFGLAPAGDVTMSAQESTTDGHREGDPSRG